LLAVPTERAIEEIVRIQKSVTWLEAVGSRFKRRVEYVAPDTTLAAVLRLIRKRDYSQFPVVDDDEKLLGLITENGITRWFAQHFESREVLTELDRICVKTVLVEDENRRAYRVIPIDRTVEAAMEELSRDPTIEALLITESRRFKLPLRGIITHWDVLQILGPRRR
jgi:CBS domain-containing protein